MTRLDQAKSVAIALAIPPVVALPLAVITGLASTGFFAFGLVAGWLYLRPRIQVVRGILLFLLYLLAKGLVILVVALALWICRVPMVSRASGISACLACGFVNGITN